jgi:hypothetical protein
MATKSTVAGQHEDFENSKAGINNSSGNGSGPATEGSAATSSGLARRATGPRTKLGKERSSRNSLKDGIFSRATLLDDEPRPQLNSLVKGLREYWRPVGMAEDILVDQLASQMWRQRRTLVAERAEIQLGKWINPLTAEREKQQREEALILFSTMERPGPGLISRSENPLILERIVELLKVLCFSVQTQGFNLESDSRILRMVFGEGKVCEPSWVLYGLCSNPGTLVKGEEFKEFDLPPEGRKVKFLETLNAYITELGQTPEIEKSIQARKRKLERLCSSVPETPRLDRLLRREASLDRAIDRTQGQLERLQRMRLGQPVLPKLEVRHSLS